MSELAHPFQKLPKLGQDCILWTAKFYNPKHSGNRDRLDRLEEQARIVMRIGTYIRHSLKDKATNACLRDPTVGSKIYKHLQMLIKDYSKESEDSNDSGDEEETQTEEAQNTATEIRIAKIFLRKRYLLNIIFFILANEEEIAKEHQNALQRIEELAQEDTNEWMEILDYVQTLKNPSYLD